jgi:osmoprotectant transport system permease protein
MTSQRPALFLLLLPILAWPPGPAAAREKPVVRIGSKAFTESVILGEILVRLAQEAGAETRHLEQLGGTTVLWKALLNGHIDVYVEYTGTLGQEILGGKVREESQMRTALRKVGVGMSQHLGFNNTYALGMREEVADRLNIRTIADLAGYPDLKFGFSEEFLERKDGWPTVKQVYGLPQTNVRGLDHTLAYKGLKTGTHQVSDLYSTDAEIISYQLRVLEDSRHCFPNYHAVLLYRKDLPVRAPEVMESFRDLEGLISNRDMTEMNARARVDRVPETQVAREFLQSKWEADVPLPEVAEEAVWSRRLALFWQNTREHLFLVAISLTAAVAVAIPLGVLSAKRPGLGRFILAAVGVIQTLPSLALLSLMVPLLGLGAWPAIVALFLYSLLPIVRNTATGLQDIPGGIHESALVLGLPAWARLWRVELPMASRSILAGIKTSAVINVGTATLGSLIGAGGYGQPIQTGIRLDDVGLILQGAVPAAGLALLVQAFFGLAERYLVPRGLRLQPA